MKILERFKTNGIKFIGLLGSKVFKDISLVDFLAIYAKEGKIFRRQIKLRQSNDKQSIIDGITKGWKS